jgi:putative hydrolases of HD superfamily
VESNELSGTLAFLRAAERLKVLTRSAYTSDGAPESIAAHSWRLCLMVVVLRDHFPKVDLARLLQICVVHDLGEALSGDVPAPEQARRSRAGSAGKTEDERRDLAALLAPLPSAARDTVLELWDEYEQGATAEARLAKALDKLETILQHNQGANPPGFDYAFNLEYGRRFTAGIGTPAFVEAIRSELDRETARRASGSS